jgi:RNA polymerase-binding transcription factor DksA
MPTDKQWRGDRTALREALEERRRQLNEDLQLRIARIRENGSRATVAKEPDDGDTCDLDVHLVEIAAATLRRVDQAIARLDHGRYGRCTRCHGPIAEARLRAMPFAVCCQRCEMLREREAARRRSVDRGRVWSDTFVAAFSPDER